jgi:hypothetical protein
MIEGALEKMSVRAGKPARYRMVLRSGAGHGDRFLDLNCLLGSGLRVEFNGRITCCHCQQQTHKSFGEGYCYPCFRRLARCDLCVLSPVRCHYQQGTCREPDWGEAFCMQPHLVYLANASGAKVGITRRDQEQVRWLDQGAVQGLVVAAADSRHLAGVLEAELARHVSDRTDWRAMLRSEPVAIDLPRLRDRLRGRVAAPRGVQWRDLPVLDLAYPVLRFPQRLIRLRLQRGHAVAGRLIGIKGQYLLFEQGVFNVRQHRSYHVRVSTFALAADEPLDGKSETGGDQMDLFG